MVAVFLQGDVHSIVLSVVTHPLQCCLLLLCNSLFFVSRRFWDFMRSFVSSTCNHAPPTLGGPHPVPPPFSNPSASSNSFPNRGCCRQNSDCPPSRDCPPSLRIARAGMAWARAAAKAAAVLPVPIALTSRENGAHWPENVFRSGNA
jgi:hypothetical protein